MTIPCSTCGVWTLDDAYKKINNSRWATFDVGIEDQTPFQLWSWGYCFTNGLNATCHTSSPQQIPGSTWVKVISCGGNRVAAVSANGTFVWGRNTCGALGLNDLSSGRSSPTQLGGAWICFHFKNYGSSFGIKNDKTVWGWGTRTNYNRLQLDSSIGVVNNISSPTQIPGTEWCLFTNGGGSLDAGNFGIKCDGTLWRWGRFCNGRGGSGLAVEVVCSASQIPGTQWVEVSDDGIAVAARKSDGTIWVWGCDAFGRLGISCFIAICSPRQVPGTQWTSVDLNSHAVALKSDNTLWVWGCNCQGNLGLGNFTSIQSPAQVPGTWICAKQSNFLNFGIKNDGTLWAWGFNYCGGLGINCAVGFPSPGCYNAPVQIPGTWIGAEAALNGGFGCKTL